MRGVGERAIGRIQICLQLVPIRQTAVIIDVLERIAVVKRILSDFFDIFGEGNGFERSAVGEAAAADLCDGSGKGNALQCGAVLKRVVLHSGDRAGNGVLHGSLIGGIIEQTGEGFVKENTVLGGIVLIIRRHRHRTGKDLIRSDVGDRLGNGNGAEFGAMAKCAAADRPDRRRNVDLLERAAMRKCHISHDLQTAGQRHLFQIGTVFKRRSLYNGHGRGNRVGGGGGVAGIVEQTGFVLVKEDTVLTDIIGMSCRHCDRAGKRIEREDTGFGNGYASHFFALPEREIADALERGRKIDIPQRMASVKGIGFDFGHGIGHLDIGEFFTVLKGTFSDHGDR